VQRGTNPCAADTDGDGVPDGEEVRWDLDPTEKVSYADGKKDGERWIVSACEHMEPGDVDYYENKWGNWQVALRSEFGNYRNLEAATGRDRDVVGATMSGATSPVAGFMAGHVVSEDEFEGPVEMMREEVLSAIGGSGERDGLYVSEAFEVRDGETSVRAEFEFAPTAGAFSVRGFRDVLLFHSAPFPPGAVDNLPDDSGEEFSEFQVDLSVIHREGFPGDQFIVMGAVGPVASELDGSAKFVPVRMRDLTNPRNVADTFHDQFRECAKRSGAQSRRPLDVYWVLEQSSFMSDQLRGVANRMAEVLEPVEPERIDARHAVTNADPMNQGRPVMGRWWNGATSKVAKGFERAAFLPECQQGMWSCEAMRSGGLEAGRLGLEAMAGGSGQLRENAEVATMFVTNHQASSAYDVIDGRWQMKEGVVENAAAFFGSRGTAYSVTGDGLRCGSEATAYRRVARGTGGDVGSVCGEKAGEVLRRVVREARFETSPYELKEMPVSSSLRVFFNGTFVPRSAEDGFTYSVEENAIEFHGFAVPKFGEELGEEEAPDRMVVVYDVLK